MLRRSGSEGRPARGRIRAGRRTNLALLASLLAAFATGLLAFGIGSGWNVWATTAHAIAAFMIVLLSPWKSVIVRRGLQRSRGGTTASIVFGVLVAVAVVSGLLHATGIATSFRFLTAMQVHVGAALLTIPLVVWHVLARRQPLRPADLGRRNLLRASAVAGASALIYLGLEGVVRLASLPGAQRRSTGSFERGSHDPPEMPVTQWLNDRIPHLDQARWTLRAPDRSWTYEELSVFDDRITAILDCTGGWYAEQEWSGVRVDRLLPSFSSDRSIEVVSTTGYRRRFPLRDAPRLLLALRVGGRELSPGHGYPARLVAPDRRGFWWVKWVESIELKDAPWWLQAPFPPTKVRGGGRSPREEAFPDPEPD